MAAVTLEKLDRFYRDPVPVPSHIPPELVVDFDYVRAADEGENPFESFTAIMKRDDIPRLFWTPRQGGHWVALNFEDYIEICRDTDNFTTYPVGISGTPISPNRIIPLEIDPPEHMKYRKILGPLFTPKEILKLDPIIRAAAIELIEGFAANGRCNFVDEFSRQMPTKLFLTLMGMPVEKLPEFLHWEHQIFSGIPDEANKGRASIAAYIREFMAEKRNNPGNDITTVLFDARPDGEPLSDQEIFDTCFMLFIAGLDTVPNTFAFTWRYLAQNDAARRYLHDPANIPDAAEEIMRLNSVVNMTRRPRHDMDFHGVKLAYGDIVVLPCAIVNRDPTQFPDPDSVVLDRESNRHVAFGAGPHRCLGSHLARYELNIALEEWLKRIPEFRLKPGYRPDARGGGTMGLLDLHLEWDV